MKSCFVKNSVHADYWVLLNLIYLFIYDFILFIYYDFIIGNKRNSAPGVERLSSKNPYRQRISSVSKKESWLYNKWYQFWQINNIFDRVRLVKLNFYLVISCFPLTKLELKNKKKIGILPILIWCVCVGEVCLYLLFISILFFHLTGSTLWAAIFT